SKCKQLAELQVCYNGNYSSRQIESTNYKSVSTQVINKYQLKSIKKLQLKNSLLLCNKTVNLSKLMPALFPNVESLVIGEQCTKTSFTKMERAFKKYQRFVMTTGSGPKSSIYRITLDDNLTEFIRSYERLYREYKDQRAAVTPK